MVKRAQQPSLTIHRQVPRGPDRGRAYGAREKCVIGRKLIERPHHVLRMDLFSSRSRRRKLIEASASFVVMLEGSLQMGSLAVLPNSWQQRSQRRFDVSDKSIVHLRAAAELFATNIHLNNRSVAWKKLLIREISSNHQQEIAIHHCVVSGRKSQQTCHSHVERVVVLDELLSAHRMHDRGVQSRSQRN